MSPENLHSLLHHLLQSESFFLGLFAGLVAGFALGAAYGVMRGRIQVFDAMRQESAVVEPIPVAPVDYVVSPEDSAAAIRERLRQIELMHPLMGRDL